MDAESMTGPNASPFRTAFLQPDLENTGSAGATEVFALPSNQVRLDNIELYRPKKTMMPA